MSQESLDVVFAGTPDFAAVHLAALLNSPHRVKAVYTQPDRPAGRGKRLQPSPVKQLAMKHALDVHQPTSLKAVPEQGHLAGLNADVLVVVAYGLILPPAILETPRLGCVNVHGSLLPRWRGAAPIQRAIEAGDTRSGVTIMQMDAGLDTGAMLARAECSVHPTTTAAELHDTLASLGAPLLTRVLSSLQDHLAAATPQPDAGATYAEKIIKSEAEIDWRCDAAELDRRIRAFNPFPVCYTTALGDRVKLWQCTPLSNKDSGLAPGTIITADGDGILVQCGSGQLRIQILQLAGGKPLAVDQVLNARAETFTPGSRLGRVLDSAN